MAKKKKKKRHKEKKENATTVRTFVESRLRNCDSIRFDSSSTQFVSGFFLIYEKFLCGRDKTISTYVQWYNNDISFGLSFDFHAKDELPKRMLGSESISIS